MQQIERGSDAARNAADLAAFSRTGYERWLDTVGVPVHKGYYIEDLREIELGPWAERECSAAFLQLAGQENISEARVTEIAPGMTLPSLRFALDEVVYVVEGRGLTTVWPVEDASPRTFEWLKHSMFLLPRGCRHQLTNSSGTDRVRLLHYNYLPLAMNLNPDPEFFFENPYTSGRPINEDLYAEARAETVPHFRGPRLEWLGNFFPDMRVWDKLEPQKNRGARARSVHVRFVESPITGHMAVFPSRTYKKAHRHGPGVVIVIPAGEGFSVMWPEGGERVVCPWHEGSVFVPPNRWFHQHFNVGGEPARYLALHSPPGIAITNEHVEDPARDQIEYTDEDPWIRQKFETELAERKLTTLMPEEAYQNVAYVWESHGEGE